MDKLNNDCKFIVGDYLLGDVKYFKSKFKDCLNIINKSILNINAELGLGLCVETLISTNDPIVIAERINHRYRDNKITLEYVNELFDNMDMEDELFADIYGYDAYDLKDETDREIGCGDYILHKYKKTK